MRSPFTWSALNVQEFIPAYWHGTVIEDKRDKAQTLYRRARQYDPATGRFTQEDPIGLAGGLNLYGFAGGDPVNFSDPFGLGQECKWFNVICLVAKLVASAEPPVTRQESRLLLENLNNSTGASTVEPTGSAELVDDLDEGSKKATRNATSQIDELTRRGRAPLRPPKGGGRVVRSLTVGGRFLGRVVGVFGLFLIIVPENEECDNQNCD